MKFKLIESSGSVIRSWEFARHYLNDNQTELNVMKMNLPVNSFVTYEFQVTSSILFRDLLFTIRPIVSAWAVSNRVIDFNELVLDEDELTFIEEESTRCNLSNKLKECIDRVNAGEYKDYVKEELPLLTRTQYSIKINLRILMSLLYTLELHAPKYFNIIQPNILSELGMNDDIYRVLIKYDMYDRVRITNSEYDIIDGKGYARVGEMHVVSGYPSANIMAQFIRQNSSIIKNELWNMFVSDYLSVASSLSNIKVHVLGYLETSAFESLTRTRTCWFAQMDKSGPTSWSCILDSIVASMSNEDFISNLPCAGNCNRCRIKGEMIPRVTGVDHNIPCPILLESPDLVDDRINKFYSNSGVITKWKESKYLIHDNPNNELRLQYGNKEST